MFGNLVYPSSLTRSAAATVDKLMALVAQLQVTPPNEEVRGEARELVAFFSAPAREHNYDAPRQCSPERYCNFA